MHRVIYSEDNNRGLDRLSDLAHFLLHLNPMFFCIIFPHKAYQYAALMNLLLPSKQFWFHYNRFLPCETTS